MTDDASLRRRRWFRIAAAVGIALAILCPYLPAPYQAACKTVATICTGGL